MSHFSEYLKTVRVKNNWKQSDLAEKANITQAAISQLEKDTRKPTPVMIEKLCTALGITKQELMGTETGDLREKEILMRKLNEVSPESIQKINEFTDFIIHKEKKRI